MNASVNGGGPERARYPHIKDLQEKADFAVKTIDPRIPIRSLLNNAQQSTRQVGTDVSFKRPDRAYVEYLIGSELLLNVIPQHKDYPSVIANRGEWAQLYRKSCKQIDTQHEMCKQIYNVIVEDNERSGVKPSGQSSMSRPLSSSSNGKLRIANGHSRPLSMPDTPTTASRQADELFLAGNGTASHSPPPHQQPSIARRGRPIVQPKPEILRDHSPRPIRCDELAERFSQLRVQRKDTPTSNGSGIQAAPQNGFVGVPSPTKYTPPLSEDSNSLHYGPQSRSEGLPSPPKPSGPREMLPPPPTKYPPPPPKIPLNARIEPQLPRAPSPAYNPSRGNISPTKTSMPSLNRKPSITGQDVTSPQSAKHLSGSSISNSYSQCMLSNKSDTGSPLRKSMNADTNPMKSMTAAELYERLQTSNILLIDVRSREDYDQGHIFAKSIMCIEPIGLKPGLSAEELEERLIVSPEMEQSFFESRGSFELVVYYDLGTASDRFLTGPPIGTIADALRALHDTLYEFNDSKPLRKSPVTLKGGLDAWTDLVGPQALATSSTAALVGSMRSRGPARKPGRPIGRVPMASANSSLEVRKRRLRDQKPLNAEEKKRWLEKARKEEVDPADYQNAQSDGDTDSDGEMPPSPFVHNIEDFLRRFPEASPVQQSMMVSIPPPPRSRPPEPPLPQQPPQSLPSIPSRPAPAVPRPSYSGVSERDNSQSSPLVRQQSSAQYPLYQSRSASLYKKLPRTGLINFSVTCYMNATIQCLVATVPLSNLFLGTGWKDLTQRNWKGSDGVMPMVYANLIRSLWRDDVAAVRPRSLRDICSRLNREWGVDRQQDAKEFFDFLVDCLHEDLNVNWQRTPLDPLTPRQEMDRERMPVAKVSRMEWDRYTHRESSHIADIFAGQHASRLRCTTCGNTSTTYEAFYSISVEIPRAAGKRPWDIYDCLRSYCKEEKLSGDEVWKCPYCKCEREATKQITITRAPWCLVIHFKRFDMQKGQSAKKVHTPIGFPLFGLNMDQYMVASRKDPDGPAEMATTPPYSYDAYAVMRHIGSSGNGGHYISLVRDAARGNIWRKFDDDRVTDFDPNKLKPDHRLQNEQAYLVFYARAIAR